jgi:putative NADPH-quinone reductase
MRLLLVVAHPLGDSYTLAIARTARDTLVADGHEVDWLDLYAEGFDPRLTADERRRYFDPSYDPSSVGDLVARLLAADGLVLIFPTWWFDMPAILKGWFDRVFAPGIAFDHQPAGGLTGRLTNIRLLYVLTTTGSPWWIVRLVMGNPLRRLLRRGIGMLCARGLRFRMLSLHDLDRASAAKREAHLERVKRLMARV